MKLRVFLLGLFAFFGGLAYLSSPQYAVAPILICAVIVFISCIAFFQSMYFRKCPRCGGGLSYTKSACLSCGINLYQVGEQSDGKEWLQ